MGLAKVVKLTDKVEVIVRKSITNENYSIMFSFIGELSKKVMIQTSLTTEYKSKKLRDLDFEQITKEHLINIGKGLEAFKDDLS